MKETCNVCPKDKCVDCQKSKLINFAKIGKCTYDDDFNLIVEWDSFHKDEKGIWKVGNFESKIKRDVVLLALSQDVKIL